MKEGKTFLLLFLAASSPLLSLAIAKCSKGPVEKGFLHLLTKLAREKGLRLRLLAISAILFAIGTALQLISTL